MIIVAGYMMVDPIRLPAFLKEVAEIERITRTEDGCLYYALAADDRDSGHITILEQWHDEAALRKHLATDHVTRFTERCGPMIREVNAQIYDAINPRPVFPA